MRISFLCPTNFQDFLTCFHEVEGMHVEKNAFYSMHIQHQKITPLIPLNLLPPHDPVEEMKQLNTSATKYDVNINATFHVKAADYYYAFHEKFIQYLTPTGEHFP